MSFLWTNSKPPNFKFYRRMAKLIEKNNKTKEQIRKRDEQRKVQLLKEFESRVNL
jgi:hypothetical protein